MSKRKKRRPSSQGQKRWAEDSIQQPNKQADAKAMKLPKRFASDFINTHKSVDTDKMAALYASAKSLGVKDSVPDTNRALHLDGVKVLDSKGNEVHVPTPRKEAINRRDQLKITERYEFWNGAEASASNTRAGRLSGFTSWNYFLVQESTNDELVLCFSLQRWVFVRLLPTMYLYSKVYSSKDEALKKHRRGSIFWAGERKY